MGFVLLIARHWIESYGAVIAIAVAAFALAGFGAAALLPCAPDCRWRDGALYAVWGVTGALVLLLALKWRYAGPAERKRTILLAAPLAGGALALAALSDWAASVALRAAVGALAWLTVVAWWYERRVHRS